MEHPAPTHWTMLLPQTLTLRREPKGCVSTDKIIRRWARVPWKPLSLFSFYLERLHPFLPGSCPTIAPYLASSYSPNIQLSGAFSCLTKHPVLSAYRIWHSSPEECVLSFMRGPGSNALPISCTISTPSVEWIRIRSKTTLPTLWEAHCWLWVGPRHRAKEHGLTWWETNSLPNSSSIFWLHQGESLGWKSVRHYDFSKTHWPLSMTTGNLQQTTYWAII